MKKILLIEDNPHLQEINKQRLQYDCNAIVETASSVFEALELLHDNHSFTFIVCDYVIPGGDGIKVLSHLEEQNQKIPFIFFTSTMGLKIETKYPHYSGIIFKFEYEKLVRQIFRLYNLINR